MKKALRSICVLCFISLANYSFSQLTKESCQDILNNIEVKSFQKLRVINPSSSSVHSTFNFEVESYSFSFNDTYLKVKDATGLSLFISYNTIKFIKSAPKTGEENSNVTIYLFD